MEQSILKSTKKVLGVDPDDTSFDLDLITYINSAFFTLNQLGAGPPDGVIIEDDTEEWDVFEINSSTKPVDVQLIKTIVYLRVRILFDPPTSAFLLDAAKEMLKENEWRLSMNREAVEWVDPDPELEPPLPLYPDPDVGFGL